MSQGFFDYRDGVMQAEEVALPALAAAVGTPFYCYSSGALETAYRDFAGALEGLNASICYALKANSNQAVVRTLARLGAGAEVVSEGELRQARAAGIPAAKTVFAGVGKTVGEMSSALEAGIRQFNVESRAELELLNRIALDRGVRAPVALRVNPDVDAETHAKISTGKAENKFGIDMAEVAAIVAQGDALPGIRIEGLAVHIGSQLTSLAPFRTAFGRLATLFAELSAAGAPLKTLDLGGGLGISYQSGAAPDLAGYGALVREATAGLDAELIFEPGRVLVGEAGLLVTRVLYVKQASAKRFVIVDAAMNDLLRPALYDAWHEIKPVAAAAPRADMQTVDVVGPVCESSDTFARQRPLPPVAPGDLLAICSSGAYGAVMSSSYNTRPLAPEILVRGADHAVVRPRPDYATLIGRDRVPDWLETADAKRGVA